MAEERKPDLLRTPAPHPAAAPVKAEPEVSNVTVPGGVYGVPGEPDKFVNAEGQPVDKSGKPIKD